MRALMLVCILTLGGLQAGRAQAARSGPSEESFSIEVSAPEQFREGQPVELTIHLMNTSNEDMNGTAAYRGSILVGYHYDVRRVGGGIVAPIQPHSSSPVVGSYISATLKPGQTGGGKTNLSELYELSPGKYSVQVSRDIRDASGRLTGATVKSNTVTFTVVRPPFGIEISTPSPEVKAGTPVPLDIRMTNLSSGDLAFGVVSGTGMVDPHFMYVCRKEGVKDVSWKGNLSQDAPPTLTLKPGGSHEQRVDVASACNLTQPGDYRIWVWRYDPQGPEHGSVRSNEITLTVRP